MYYVILLMIAHNAQAKSPMYLKQAGKKPEIAREPGQILFKILPRDPKIIPRNPKIFPQDPKFLTRESKILSKLIHTTSVMGKMTALINS